MIEDFTRSLRRLLGIPKERQRRRIMKRGLAWAVAALFFIVWAVSASAEEQRIGSPAEGFNIHVVAPHKHEDGTVHGPYHHYCKVIKPEISAGNPPVRLGLVVRLTHNCTNPGQP